MSLTVLWGVAVQPPEYALRRRATSDGSVRSTSEGDIRVAYIPPSQIRFNRVTSQGDRRKTSASDVRITIDGVQGPSYLKTADVTSDGGEPFALFYESGPWQPAAQGGECVFAWLRLTVSWSMGATIRVRAWVDGEDATVNLPDGSRLENVPVLLTLPQDGGTLQRQTQVVDVPLVRRQVLDEVEVSRWFLRGQRLAFAVESTGALGVGELMLEGAEVEWQPVRKAIYRGTVDVTP